MVACDGNGIYSFVQQVWERKLDESADPELTADLFDTDQKLSNLIKGTNYHTFPNETHHPIHLTMPFLFLWGLFSTFPVPHSYELRWGWAPWLLTLWGISLPHCLLLYRAAETQSCFPFSNAFSFPCSPASAGWIWTNFVRFCSTTAMWTGMEKFKNQNWPCV